MKESILRELRRKRHIHLPERPKIVSWDLDCTLIDNGKEDSSKKGLEDLWTNGFTNIITTASPKDFAIEQIKARDWQHYIHSIYGNRVSGEGKPYLDIAREMKLTPEEYSSNFVIVGDPCGDIPIDLFSVLVFSDNPEKVAKLIKNLDESDGFIGGYLGNTPKFAKVCYSRLWDKKNMPVLADTEMQFQTADRY